jgi:hypothetical protein
MNGGKSQNIREDTSLLSIRVDDAPVLKVAALICTFIYKLNRFLGDIDGKIQILEPSIIASLIVNEIHQSSVILVGASI